MEHGKLTKLLTSGPCRTFAPPVEDVLLVL